MIAKPLWAQWLRTAVVALVTALLGGLLAATLYWTYFDPRWITFLGGVLFAAVLSAASQMSRAESRAARSAAEAGRLQVRLDEETALRRKAEAALRMAEEQLSVLQGAVEAATPNAADDALVVESLTEGKGWEDPRAKLAEALRQDQFLLLQQRIEPLSGSAEAMYEILLRLREEEDNLLPPGGFFPVAERYGMMESLDRWVVTHLMKRCGERRLGERGWKPPVYCVNLSSAAVLSPDFAQFVRDEIQARNFDGGRLCLEIAEPELIARPNDVRRLVATLKPAGCRFTADAFGSSKASFAPLRGLALDFLKIDGVIVQNLLRNPAELARARTIAAVCRKIGVRTIAEFVEDEATRAKLAEIGVDYVQGFGVARPEPWGIAQSVDSCQLARAAA
ncbi:MAG TPA: EAL domain-containing protein [Burkholderiales bacterium]|nr:EAL domain-containing protein [Burkholderiales bacterium]